MTEFQPVETTLTAFVQRGDLAHLALLCWACGASALLLWALKEIANAHRRYEQFVSELARLNRLFGDEE